jgi:PqqD family protein of HPr-rel-A system
VSQCAQTLQLTLHADEVGLPMYRVSEGVRSTHGQDGAIVLDIRQGQMFNLNFVGSRILELLNNGSTESAIADQLSRDFDVSRDIAEQDVREFIDTLKEHRLVRNSGPDIRD